jgi:hypothetical protein
MDDHQREYAASRTKYEDLLTRLGDRLFCPCAHEYTEPGPRHPLLYGSHATEVCQDCGRFRRLWYRPDSWTEWTAERIKTFKESEEDGYV